MRKKILNLHSDKPNPPRFCDAVRGKDGKIYLEVKNVKNATRILWQDVQFQMKDFGTGPDKEPA